MRQRVRTVAVIGVGVGLMVFVLRSAELDRVAEGLASARHDLIAVALVATLSTYVVRAIRWRYLLAPIGRVGFVSALRATVMGFAATSLLPGRVGEILRPYVLARHEDLSTSAVIATVVLERLLDLGVILAMFGVSVVAFDPRFAAGDRGLLEGVRFGAAAAATGAGALFVLAFAAAGNPARMERLVERVTRVLPRRPSTFFRRVARRFVDGLAVMRRPGLLLWATAWSVALWVLIAGGLWLVSLAFGIEMPLAGAGALLVLVAAGVAVPTPAGIGGYHAAYQIGATGLYAAAPEAAVGAGLVAHAISFLPVTIAGLLLMAQEGIRMRAIGRLAEPPAPDGGAAPAVVAGAAVDSGRRSVGQDGGSA